MEARTTHILPANAAVVIIGLLDLITTIFLVCTGRAVEANPVMAALLDAGLPIFIVGKASTLAAYFLVMEWYKQRNLSFVQAIGKFTALAYLASYTVCFCLVNYRLFLS